MAGLLLFVLEEERANKVFEEFARLFGDAGWIWGTVTKRYPSGYYYTVGETREEVLERLKSKYIQNASCAHIAKL